MGSTLRGAWLLPNVSILASTDTTSVKAGARGATLLFVVIASDLLRKPACLAVQLLWVSINSSITASRVVAQELLKPPQGTASFAPIHALIVPRSPHAKPASAAIF